MNDKLVAFPKRRKGKKKCPICGRPPNPPTELFCSKRCADEDMRRWLGGEYRIPSAERPDFGADEDESGPPALDPSPGRSTAGQGRAISL